MRPRNLDQSGPSFRATAEYLAMSRRRMAHFVPNYLAPLIPPGACVCSAGCGVAYDIELLTEMGYDAWGFDSGARTKAWCDHSPLVQERLRLGHAEDKPFGDKTFDFVYALEVIEHVGCGDGGWEILETTVDSRLRFIESCVGMLRDGGRVFLSTSNRLCPIDIGHAHRYAAVTAAASRLGVNLTLPWHPRNFVLSFGDIARLVERSHVGDRVSVRAVSSLGYLAFSSRAWARPLSRAVDAYMWVVNLPPLRRSPANALTTVMLETPAHGVAGRELRPPPN